MRFNLDKVNTNKFCLNREFIVEEIKVDDQSICPKAICESIKLEGFEEYIVNQYTLPLEGKTIEIKYTGFLSGKTGICPYVQEKITEEFTFLRWETFCYPLFLQDGERSVYEYLSKCTIPGEIIVNVPKSYGIVSTQNLKMKISEDCRTIYYFEGDWHNFSASIAKYKYVKLNCGEFYLMSDKVDMKLIEDTLQSAHNFLNSTFGHREINSNIKYGVVPDGLGQFAKNNTIYIVESALSSVYNLCNVVHEFIHLGWNVKTNMETHRTRFFDEAFTQYFTMRVMEKLLNKEEYRKFFNRHVESFNNQKKRLTKDVPIVEFGIHEYGDLSYTIGVLCLKELENIIGREDFDCITKLFLEKYKDSIVDFKLFYKEYSILSSETDIKEFFDEWIYSTSGYRKYLY